MKQQLRRGGILAFALGIVWTAPAADRTWNAGVANWGDHFKWSPTVVPDSSTTVLVDNGGTPTVGAGVTAASSTLTIGNAATGNLAISDGGDLVSGAATLGSANGSTGIATLTGSGSTWAATSLTLGASGAGTLTVSGSGALSVSGATTLGSASGSTGIATLTGSGSTWTTASLAIGASGSGTLTVSAGGALTVGGGSGTISIASSGGSSGTLNIGAFDLSTAAGTISAGTYAFGVGAGVLNFNQTGSLTFGNAITGLGSIVQRGSGTTTIASSSVLSGFIGGISVTGGTLATGSPDVIPNGVIVTIAGGTLNFGGNNETLGTIVLQSGTLTATAGQVRAAYDVRSGVISAQLVGPGPLTKTTAGTVTLTRENTYTGGTTISGGTLELGDGGMVTGNITNNAALVFNRLDNVSFSSVISGAGAVEKKGAANLTFLSAQTYTGVTTISAGTLTIPSGSGLQGNIVNNAALVLGNSSYGGAISGTGTLTVPAGPGLTLTGNNTFTGVTTVQAAGGLSVGNGGASGAMTGNIALGANPITFNRSDDSSYGGVISGTGSLTKLGAGTLTLTGTNTYTGGVTISGGTILLDSLTARLSGVGALTINGGTLDVGSAQPQTFASFTLVSGTLAGTTGGILSNGGFDVRSGTIGARLSGLSSSLTKTTSGTVVLTQTSNPYGGGTAVNGGVLAIPADATLGTGALSFNGGALRYDAAFNDLRAFTIGASGATLDTNGFNVTLSNAASGSALTKAGAGTLTLSATNTNGSLAVTGGAVRFTTGANLGAGAVTLNGGGLQWASGSTVDVSNRLGVGASGGTLDTNGNDITFASAITGSGGLTKIGAGTLTFNAAAALPGASAVTGGSLAIGAGGNVSTQALAIGDATAASLQISGGGDLSSAASTLGNSAGGAGTATISGAGSTWAATALTVGGAGAGALTLSGGASVTVGGGSGAVTLAQLAGSTGTLNVGPYDLSGTGGTLSAGTVAIGAGAGAVNFNQTDSVSFPAAITGAVSVLQRGSGTTTLAGASAYTGGTTISAGTLALGASNSLPDAGAIAITGGTLALGAFSDTVGAVTLDGGSITGSGTLSAASVEVNSGAISANLGGAGGVVINFVNFEGVATMTGNNTYSGGTTIRGTLSASGSLGTGAVVFDGGENFVSLNIGGFGNLATLTMGSILDADFPHFDLELGAGGASDKLIVTSFDGLNIPSAFISFYFAPGYTPSGPATFDVLAWSGTANFEVGLPDLELYPGLAWDQSQLLTNGTLLLVSTIPEPGTAALGVLAAVIVALRARRRCRA